MSKFISLLLGVLFVSTSTQAQLQLVSTKPKAVYAIPFRVTAYNNIVIQAILNGKDTVNLMLHTAASDITLTEEAVAKLTTIRLDGKVEGVQSWGGGENSSDFSKNNTLRIGNLTWKGATVWRDKNSGQQTDGKFGLNLFEGKVIELDFDRSLLLVSDKMPRRVKQYEAFQLVNQDDLLFIKATCHIASDSFENKFLIHSGYSGGVLLDDEFVNKTQLGQRIPITGEKKLQDAYGNVLTTKKGTLPVFAIGQRQLSNVPVGFFEGAIGRQKMSIIGGDIIKRFNWIIDAQRVHIYLKTNHLFETDFSNI
ncbi:MAG: retropepsin-like aspartic protease [Spirosomataceae bacterium]